MDFKVGDKVSWISSNTKKVGEVTHILSPGQRPRDVGVSMESGLPRDHVTYVLRGHKVRYDGRGVEKRAANYWPYVSLITPE